ncbi:hypothetical protein CQW23_00694 [Capsicum baccatum]|uniref:BRX domain-containing protein n=1 Tax=Capsicum baccatum TaxID=33114 RepID=A0A2G2XLU3_CAPBA|nr:hypothetical protein CQW23_00694 [Capsicum baccatum]
MIEEEIFQWKSLQFHDKNESYFDSLFKEIDSKATLDVLQIQWLFELTSIVECKRAYHGQARVKTSIVECVEQYQLGFFITLIVLPSGKKGLRRVKFSGKEFTEKETKNWWEENQLSIYIKYDIEGYENLNQDLLKK